MDRISEKRAIVTKTSKQQIVKILHVADRLTDRGGAYRHLLGVLEHQRREHDVELAVGCDDGNLELPRRLVPGLEARTRMPVDVSLVMEEFRPDVVHVHNVMNPAALEALGDYNEPVRVMTVQDHRAFCPGRGKWTLEGETCSERMSAELCQKCFTNAAYGQEIEALTNERLEATKQFRLVVLSRYMKRELVAVGIEDDRITVVPPFVHGLHLDATSNGPPSVLFVGRLVESKGVVEAIAAWERSGLDLPLVVAGTGPLRDSLKRPGVALLGWVGRAELSSLYRRAAAVLMSSRWQEPFGIVGLESLVMGTPVVAWESGGIGEWHPGPLTKWGDIDALARELRVTVGRSASPPVGFESPELMRRLHDVYTPCDRPTPLRRPRVVKAGPLRAVSEIPSAHAPSSSNRYMRP